MDALATIDDLEAGWRALGESERSSAMTLLTRASAMIRGLMADRRVAIDPADEVQAVNLVAVTCSCVRRSMDGQEVYGVSQMQQTGGPYSVGMSFSNPTGDLYLTKAERRALGLSGARCGSVAPRSWGDGDE